MFITQAKKEGNSVASFCINLWLAGIVSLSLLHARHWRTSDVWRIDWHKSQHHPTLCLFNCAVNNQDRIMQNDRGYSNGSLWEKRGCGET